MFIPSYKYLTTKQYTDMFIPSYKYLTTKQYTMNFSSNLDQYFHPFYFDTMLNFFFFFWGGGGGGGEGANMG